MIKRIWDSPTITTWLSYSTKTLSLFAVLPLILKLFSPADVVLYYLFFTIISLQSIADFGFRQTFSRVISFAFGGASDIGVFGALSKNTSTRLNTSGPNISLLNNIVVIMKYIYGWLSVILFVLMAVFGTWSMVKPINDSSNVNNSWWCWIIVLLVTCISFYGKIYLNFLEGLYKITLVRRIEILTSLGGIITSTIVLLTYPSLLNMIIANQFWVLVNTIRDWYLCKKVDNGFYNRVSHRLPFDKSFFLKIWQPAWRSGISGLMATGLTNLTGLVYAQIGSSAAVAGYLLALRVINLIKEVSMAPFYSKVPLMAILRVKNDMNSFIKMVTRGMFLSHLSFIVGIIIVGVFSNQVLTMIHSHVKFVDQKLWILLSVAFFMHRYGAMHMQIYLSTNHIISHIADGISGILYIISSLILSRYIRVYAIPVGMLVGYFGFYAWYAAIYSYRSIRLNFWRFELQTSFIPIVLLSIYIIISLFYEKSY